MSVSSVRKLTAIDVFSGCGGLTTGLKKAGFSVVAAVELDELAAKTFSMNHPRTKLLNEDIRKVDAVKLARDLKLRKGQLDLLAGCPPCQGFSTMRTLNGNKTVSDPRNNLINDFLRLIVDLSPKVIMLENVPGLGGDSRFDKFKKKISSLGYKHINVGVINFEDYGVPQSRRRLILIASKKKNINFPEKKKSKRTVRDAIGHLPRPGKSGDAIHDLLENRSEKVMKIIKEIPKDGGSRSELPDSLVLDCHKKFEGFSDVYGRLSWDKPSVTITSGCFNPSKGRFIHPEQDRAITMREAALIQTFPAKYKFSLDRGKTGVALMIGNALPPRLISEKGKIIKKYIEKNYRV